MNGTVSVPLRGIGSEKLGGQLCVYGNIPMVVSVPLRGIGSEKHTHPFTTDITPLLEYGVSVPLRGIGSEKLARTYNQEGLLISPGVSVPLRGIGSEKPD